MKRHSGPIIAAAKELADLCAQIRAAHPEHAWNVKNTAPIEEQPDPRIETALRMYQAGAPNKAIAEYLGIGVSTLFPAIARWRRRGWWPDDARRTPGRPRKG